jgi:hypothetical protein
MYRVLKLHAWQLAIIAILSVAAFEAVAQQFEQVQEIAPSNINDPNLGFGTSVDVYGSTMVIGRDDFPSSTDHGLGGVYVFERLGGVWTETQFLLPADFATGDYLGFGYTASLHGDRLAVGAREVLERYPPEEPDEIGTWKTVRGVVFVFQRVNGVWVQEDKLTVDHLTATVNDSGPFGQNLAVHLNTLVVSTVKLVTAGVQTPAVFVYVKQETGWELQAELTSECVECGYGRSVDLYEDTIAVGGYLPGEWSDGFVDVYVRSGAEWVKEAQLVPSDGIVGRELGNRVSLHGDSLLAGAIRDGDNGALSGAVYEFTRTGGVWSQANKITPMNGGSYKFFSYDVHHNGKTAVVSEFNAAGMGSSQDDFEMVVFEKQGTGWSEVAILERFPSDVDGRSGNEVVVKGNEVAVANRHYAPSGDLGNQGRVWMYALNPETSPETDVGEDVLVQPTVEDLDGNPLTDAPEFNFTFEDIDGVGETIITVIDPSPETTTPPLGFSILGLNDGSALFDFHTTATMAPGSTVEICIDYSAMDIAGDPADLIFAHEVDGVWQDITSSNDVGEEIICGVTDSFSYFALLEVADPIQLLEELIQAVAALNAKHGIVNSLDAKLSAAKKALQDAKANRDLSAINVLMHSFISAVEAQRGNQILEAEADHLIALAMGVAAAIEAGP